MVPNIDTVFFLKKYSKDTLPGGSIIDDVNFFSNTIRIQYFKFLIMIHNWKELQNVLWMT